MESDHKVPLCQSKDKFVTDYEVMPEQVPDCALGDIVIESHQELFGEASQLLPAGTGFNPGPQERKALQQKARTLAWKVLRAPAKSR